jgi:hypothetical protein
VNRNYDVTLEVNLRMLGFYWFSENRFSGSVGGEKLRESMWDETSGDIRACMVTLTQIFRRQTDVQLITKSELHRREIGLM